MMDNDKSDSASSSENNGNDSSEDSSSGGCDVSVAIPSNFIFFAEFFALLNVSLMT